MEEIRITIIMVNVEITIIQMIILEFGNLMDLLSIPPKKNTNWELSGISPLKKNTQKFQIENNVQIYVSSCTAFL